MKTASIITPDARVFNGGLIHIRRELNRLHVMYASGSLSVKGEHLEHLLRELLHGQIQHIEPGDCQGSTIKQVDFTPTPGTSYKPLPWPDPCQVPRNWLLIESDTFADYYPMDALEVIARVGRAFFINIAANTYRLATAPEDLEALRQELIDAVPEHTQHLTCFPAEAFPEYAPWPRLHFHKVETSTTQIDTTDSNTEVLLDRRAKPAIRAFRQRIQQPGQPRTAPAIER